jgi:uncharacterized protein with HEPN domain
MQRSYEYFLPDMLKSARRALEKARHVELNQLLGDLELQESILWNLLILGEALTHVPEEVKDQFPQINWRRTRRLRNLVAHAYFGIDWEVMFRVSRSFLPKLIVGLEEAVSRHPVPQDNQPEPR